MLRVRITTTNETPARTEVLCDSPDPLPRHNLRVNGTSILQLADIVRADFGKVFDRKNRRPRIEFDVARDSDDEGNKFDSELAATLFALDHACSDCPTSGDVTLEIGSGDGGSATRWIKGAGIERLGMQRQVGRTLFFSYAIVGGQYLKSNPTPGN